MTGLYPMFLRAPGSVRRALEVQCPACREQPGQACKIEDGTPMVHDARESLAPPLEAAVEIQLSARRDELWYGVFSDDERTAVLMRLSAQEARAC